MSPRLESYFLQGSSTRNQYFLIKELTPNNLYFGIKKIQKLDWLHFWKLKKIETNCCMAYWLLKTEPEDYSYNDLECDRTTVWDGVSNPLALKYMRTVVIGDLALIYHTGKERRVVGIAEVISQPYADPKLSDDKQVVIDVKLVKRLPQTVTLAQIKQDSLFEGFELLRLPRLSVVPVSDLHWHQILKLAGE